jgi:hypothetical protein
MRRPDGAHKIGRSRDPKARRSTVASEFGPVELVCAIAVADMGEAERLLHQAFDHKRLAGEWFDLAEDDVRTFKEMSLPAPPEAWTPHEVTGVKIAVRIYRKAKLVAADRRIPLAALLSELLDKPVEREYQKLLRDRVKEQEQTEEGE